MRIEPDDILSVDDTTTSPPAASRGYLVLQIDAVFQRAARRRDRRLLRRAVQRRARDLDVNAEALFLDYVVGLVTEDARFYRIAIEVPIDRDTLARADGNSLEDLVFTFALLERVWSFTQRHH